MKTLNPWIQGGFYLFAGLNHFINPQFYVDLIPAYLGNEEVINMLAGVAELALGAGLFVPRIRWLAGWGIILMLLAFIPSHVYFVQVGGCIDGGLCVPEWVGWLRLLLIHPLLIYWAWTATRS